MRLTRRRNPVAQDWQDEAGDGEWEAERLQEDLGSLYEFRQESETRKDQLGHAPIPPWTA